MKKELSFSTRGFRKLFILLPHFNGKSRGDLYRSPIKLVTKNLSIKALMTKTGCRNARKWTYPVWCETVLKDNLSELACFAADVPQSGRHPESAKQRGATELT